MSLTSVQLRQRVAEELRVYSPDQELSADVASRIDDSITDTTAELRERGLCWWSADAIPNSVAHAMTLIVAARACTKFGKKDQGYESGDEDGRSKLSTLKGSVDIATGTADYF